MAEPLEVDIACEHPRWDGCEARLAGALTAAAQAEDVDGSVAVLLADNETLARLNRDWRGKDGPTNVLSFPAAPAANARFLGDIALAAETVAAEAENQGKTFEDHATHLAVHGFLHLLGYDHQTESEAEAMEGRERAILAALGIADPYA